MPPAAKEYTVAATASAEERLWNLQALGAGFQFLMRDLLVRLASYHELLQLELEDSPGAETYLREAAGSLEKATQLATLFQQLVSADSESLDESFELKALLRGVAGRLEKIGFPVAQDYGEPAGGEIFVRGKLVLLHQAVFDLLLLAARESGQASPQLAIRLSTETLDEKFLKRRKSELAPGDYSVTLVRAGDAQVELEQLVRLNERLCASAASAARLNERLLYVLGVVREHGGELLVPLGANAFDTVAILLPAQHNKVEMFGETTLDEPSQKGRETILLVDDEGIVWDVVIDMLNGLGYTVVLAADGRDCVEIYRENKGQIDLVLLDMVMPEMNGREAFFALKEIDPGVKVLLQSGYVAEEDARDVLDAGAAGFLRKPYRMNELAKRIRQVLDRTTTRANKR